MLFFRSVQMQMSYHEYSTLKLQMSYIKPFLKLLRLVSNITILKHSSFEPFFVSRLPVFKTVLNMVLKNRSI